MKKTTFWPMIGGIGEGFANYLLVVRKIDATRLSKQELVGWLVDRFAIATSYAGNVVTTLFTGVGVFTLQRGACTITDRGRALLENSSPRFLYRLFADQFLGVAEIPSLLADKQPLNGDALFDAWFEIIEAVIGKRWNHNHARMQFKHRVDWLRSLDIISKVVDGYYLSTRGTEEIAHAKTRAAKSPDERDAISHNDIENKLKSIGEFFEFMSIKRASVNDARPYSDAVRESTTRLFVGPCDSLRRQGSVRVRGPGWREHVRCDRTSGNGRSVCAKSSCRD